MNKKNIASFILISALCLSSTFRTESIEAFEPGDLIISNTFDDPNEIGCLYPMGFVTLELDTANGNNSTSSIKITDRTESWNGAGIFDHPDIVPGNTYEISAYVFHYSDKNEDLLWTMKTVKSDASTSYNTIIKNDTPPMTWTKIGGTFTIPIDVSQYAVYIESSANTMDICIDDITITLVEQGETIVSEETTKATEKITEATEETTASTQEMSKTQATTPETSKSSKSDSDITDIPASNSDNNNSWSVIFPLALIALTIIAILIIYLIKNNKINFIRPGAKDSLTGVFSKEEYNKKIKALSVSQSMYKELYIAVCDVCFMKTINESFGYGTGDEALTKCARILSKIVGMNGHVYRTDGGTFVCISKLPFRNRIETEFDTESHKNKQYPFFIAAGFSFSREDNRTDINTLIQRAENEMQSNKAVIKSGCSNIEQKYKIKIINK